MAMLRSAGVLVLAFVASTVAGMLACAAVSLLPDWNAGGGSLDEAARGLLTAAYVALCILLYGLAAWRRDRVRHLKRALHILLLAPVLVAILGVADHGIHGIDWLHQAVGMVQMVAPPWSVALLQWLILQIHLSRRTPPAKPASMAAPG